MKVILFLIRMILGSLLLLSGLGAIGRPFAFLASVNAYQLTGPLSGVVVAGLLPWLEGVTGICLIAGILTDGALLGAVLLTALFAAAIGSAWFRHLSISCGCFGGTEDIITGYTFFRAMTLLAMAIGGWVISLGFCTEDLLGGSRFAAQLIRAAPRRRRGMKAPGQKHFGRRAFSVSAGASIGQSIAETAPISR